MHIDPTLSQAEPRNVKQVDGEMASHSVANVMLKAIGISSSCVTVSLCVCGSEFQGCRKHWNEHGQSNKATQLWFSFVKITVRYEVNRGQICFCALKTTDQNVGQKIKTSCAVCVCKRSFNVICVWQSCGKTNTSPEAALHTVMEKTRFGADVDLELLDWVPQSIRYMHWKTLQVHLWSIKETDKCFDQSVYTNDTLKHKNNKQVH